ncbi:MAG: signal peptidase I [Thermoanaerobaculales bacterium]|nr:signal peptidase I [Thermoanaerobaculales bacterium]
MHSRTWTREFVEVLLIFVIFTLFVRTFVVAHINVPTPSMEPAVLVGDHILVNRFVYAPHWDSPLHRLLPYREPQVGDIVTFAQPDRPRRDLIKRVVAVPGDTLAIESKQLIRNHVHTVEAWARHTDPTVWPNDESTPPSRRTRDHLDETLIPSGHVFCLGDNRDQSQDSRVFGPVARSDVRGRALLVYWSFDPSGAESAGGVRRLLYVPLNFFSETRWNRQFTLVR